MTSPNFMPYRPGRPTPTLDPRLWEVRAFGADEAWAQESARLIGPRAVIVQVSEFMYSVFKPKFDEIKIESDYGDSIDFDIVQMDDEWKISMTPRGGEPTILDRDIISQLLTTALPECAALLDTLRHTPAHAHLRSRTRHHKAGHDRLSGNS